VAVTALAHSALLPPSLTGYAVVLIGPLPVGVLLYHALVLYYRRGARTMSDFLSVVSEFLRYRHRGWILLATTLALPAGFLIGLLVTPSAAGKSGLASSYAFFLQTMAGAIIALLVVIAVQARRVSRQTRFATREAGMLAVFWTVLGEIAALAALSPGLPTGLQRPAFSLMVGGALAGLLALLFIAGWVEAEDE
jgi:hypothetical protein